jgi:hypothetical protein
VYWIEISKDFKRLFYNRSLVVCICCMLLVVKSTRSIFQFKLLNFIIFLVSINIFMNIKVSGDHDLFCLQIVHSIIFGIWCIAQKKSPFKLCDLIWIIFLLEHEHSILIQWSSNVFPCLNTCFPLNNSCWQPIQEIHCCINSCRAFL